MSFFLLKQACLLAFQPSGHGKAHVVERAGCQNTSSGCALNEALLDQVGLDDVFNRIARLGEGGGYGFYADRAAAKIDANDIQIAPVELIKADGIHFQLA